MIIEIEKGHEGSVARIRDIAAQHGNRIDVIAGGEIYDTIHVIGDARDLATRMGYIADLPGVERVWRISSDWKNIARVVSDGHGKALHRERRQVAVAGPDGHARTFGGPGHVFVVGPDSVQTEAQTMAQAQRIAEIADRYDLRDRIMLRAGAFKPRTRPTDFRGLGMVGIEILDRVRDETGLPYVTEVMDHTRVVELAAHADMLQIGTRNAQDFDLLEAVGRSGRPVLLKRGFGNDASEWFSAAEYVANQGNLDIVLCERGVKTMFAKDGYSRFTPDFNVIRHTKDKTILPVIFDPSHAAGDDRIVAENLMAAVAYQPDGSITETIHDEEFRAEQLCDARQALHLDLFERIVSAVLDFEATVLPHLRVVDDYFTKRASAL